MVVTCDNPSCGQSFVYRRGPAHFERATRHYCSRRCRDRVFREKIETVCANPSCERIFDYRHGRVAFAKSERHYCSPECWRARPQGGASLVVRCANALCGKEFTYGSGRAHFRRSKNHYCCRSCQNTTHGLAGSARHKIWERLRRRARKQKIPFGLTVHDIPEVPARCPVLGIEIKANSEAGPLDSSPSVDKIDPSRGYVPGNIRIISNRANRIRSDATAEELYKIAQDAEALEAHKPVG